MKRQANPRAYLIPYGSRIKIQDGADAGSR